MQLQRLGSTTRQRVPRAPVGYEVPVRRGDEVVTEYQVSNAAIGVQTSTLAVLLERPGIEADWLD